VLSHYNGITRALIDLFPSIGLDESKFPHYPNRHWLEIGNRRNFFEKFAKDNHFDPLIPTNWYKVPKETIQATKGIVSVLSYYNNSFPRTVKELFTNIGLDETKFATIPRHYWKEKKNRRKFLEDFAHAQGFDARVAENWYGVGKEKLIYLVQDGKIVSIKGATQIMGYHSGSMAQAIVDLFPDITFDKSKFVYL